jgi:hypothetical protein
MPHTHTIPLPTRVGFKGSDAPLSVNNVLNIGVCPKSLIAAMRARFEVLGGVIYEHTAFRSAVVASDGVVVSLANAAGAPADVEDTNRPNAVQQQQEAQLRLHSPFGAVLGSGANGGSSSSGVQQGLGGEQQQQLHSNNGGRGNSSSGSVGSSSGSRYERWLAASGLSSSSRYDGQSLSSSTPADGQASVGVASGASATHSARVEQQHSPQRSSVKSAGTAAAAAAAAAQGSRPTVSSKAPKQLTCRLLLDCMGEC